MSPQTRIDLKKYGQVTNVFVGGKLLYSVAIIPTYTKRHIEMLLAALGVKDVVVEILE